MERDGGEIRAKGNGKGKKAGGEVKEDIYITLMLEGEMKEL